MKMTTEYALTRGVSEILPSKKNLASLMGNKKITLYQGFDPTSPHLHIGHFIGLRKLAQFQSLGHKVIFLIGDFTAMIGDPTDKSAARTKLTKEEVKRNLKNYKEQAGKVLRFTGKNAAEVMFNSKWLGRLSFEDVLELSSHFTVQQMIERSMFQERLKNEKPIYLSEFMYPLMQGYDSVALGVDLEIGGNDQLFNMMAGRELSRSLKNKNKLVLTTKLLTDPSGKKMGKTEGNAVNLDDKAEDIFGKVMSMPDSMLPQMVELLTDLSIKKITDPLSIKKEVAFEVVRQIKGGNEARNAQTYFEGNFQKGEIDYSRKIILSGDLTNTVKGAISGASASYAKGLIAQGGTTVNNEVIKDPKHTLSVGDKIKIGKKLFGTVVKK